MVRRVGLVWVVLLAACQQVSPGGAHDWIRTDLYLGMTRRDSSVISEGEFQRFVDARVTPLFPEGFTVTAAAGQYLDEGHVLHKEPSRVLTILYPRSGAQEADRKVREIVAAYCRELDQESVLRTDGVERAEFVRPGGG
jgi:Protein of unknown function (DUF3574)